MEVYCHFTSAHLKIFFKEFYGTFCHIILNLSATLSVAHHSSGEMAVSRTC